MAIIYSTAVKTARMTAVRDQLDGGAGPGIIEIGSSAMATVLVTIPLNDPSGTISGNVLTLSGFPKTIAASVAGVAASARLRDSNNVDIITGLTVGTSGTDIIVDNTNIAVGQNVIVAASPTFTHS